MDDNPSRKQDKGSDGPDPPENITEEALIKAKLCRCDSPKLDA